VLGRVPGCPFRNPGFGVPGIGTEAPVTSTDGVFFRPYGGAKRVYRGRSLCYEPGEPFVGRRCPAARASALLPGIVIPSPPGLKPP
jgi:hypothetical protein